MKRHHFTPSCIHVIDAVRRRFTISSGVNHRFIFRRLDVELQMVALLCFHLLHQTRLTELLIELLLIPFALSAAFIPAH